ncbi:MAG: hypothetical protein R3279_08550 [Putridiphycobacter sp.]|nr:hypothetical protein [Putridiphycobacter sp.]
MKKSIRHFSIMMLLSVFALLSFSDKDKNASAEKQDLHEIMFNINAVLTYDEAQAIDKKISLKDGIFVSRTNPSNSIYYCLSEVDKNLNETQFKEWFNEMGYEISCFNKIVLGKGVSKTFDELENCK